MSCLSEPVSELDHLYSPSNYCKRFDRQGSLRYYDHFIKRESEHVRKILSCHLNIPYGKELSQKLDIYGTDLKDDAPVFIFIHGGYWQAYSKEESCFMAEMLYSNGIKTIVIGFTLCPLTTLARQIDEINYGVQHSLELCCKSNTKKVVIAGHSSGAHLVATLLDKLADYKSEQRALIKGLILIDGIYDLTPLVNTYVNDTLHLTKEQAQELSPYWSTNLDESKSNVIIDNQLPIFIILAEYESPAFIQQSNKYNQKLINNHFNVKLITCEKQDHFTIVEHLMDSSNQLSLLIIQLLS